MRIRRKLAVAALGSSLAVGALGVAPAQAAQESVQALPAGCVAVKNLTNARGTCTAPGNYRWHLHVECSAFTWANSDVMTGPGSVNVYCTIGRVSFAAVYPD